MVNQVVLHETCVENTDYPDLSIKLDYPADLSIK
jgi:hypothetical protein